MSGSDALAFISNSGHPFAMKFHHLFGLAIIAATVSGAGLLAASNASIGDQANRLAAVRARPNCLMPDGWAQVAARKPHFVIFGENHGTEEAPKFVGDIACALAAKGEHVLVAVEHDSSQNAAFQAAWSLEQSQFEAALRVAGWKDREDGVTSEAMFHLLVRLHSLKDAGGSISIVAFNGARDEAQHERFKALPGQGPHEAAQAENIREVSQRHRYDHVLVLVGNLHARKHEVERGGFTFKPMAMLLAPPDEIVTLNMVAAKGTSWNCMLKPGHKPQAGKPIMADAIECGVHAYSGDGNLQRLPFISLKPVAGIVPGDNYDGFYWLGNIHGSRPAVPKS